MMKIVRALTPDIVLDLFSFLNKVLVVIGIADKPKDFKAIAEKEKADKVSSEVDSLFRIGQVDSDREPWEPYDREEDDVLELAKEIDEYLVEELSPLFKTMASSGRKVEAIKSVRLATGWGYKEAKLFTEDYLSAVGDQEDYEGEVA